jgi:hypothetical protein
MARVARILPACEIKKLSEPQPHPDGDMGTGIAKVAMFHRWAPMMNCRVGVGMAISAPSS